MDAGSPRACAVDCRQACARTVSGVDVGSTLKLNGQPWRVVGEFEANDANDSDLWGDSGVVGPTSGEDQRHLGDGQAH
jgi:hypothetical protein